MKRAALAVSFGILLCGSFGARATDLEDRDWILVRTPHFEIQSTMDEQKTMKLARYLQVIRFVTASLTNTEPFESPIPLRVYTFGNPRTLEDLGVESRATGFSIPGLRRNTIVVRDSHGLGEISAILEQYVQYLLRNQNALVYPLWFDVGFARYLGSARFYGETLDIGAIPSDEWNQRIGGWTPLEQIIGRDAYSNWSRTRGRFYSESWALVHFMLNRPGHDGTLGPDMATYIELTEHGTGELEALDRILDIQSEGLDIAVQSYLRPGVFINDHKWTLPHYPLDRTPFLKDFHPGTVTPSRAQASLNLGDLALSIGQLETAEHLYEIAVTDPAVEARAEAGLGHVLQSRGKFNQALLHFQRAIDLAPDDPDCLLDYAEYWHDRARITDAEDRRTEGFERARRYFLKARKLDDSRPEMFAEYGSMLVDEAQDFTTAVQMLEHARSSAPSNESVKLALAKAYVGTEQYEDAALLARSVLTWSRPDTPGAKAAQEILDQLPAEDR